MGSLGRQGRGAQGQDFSHWSNFVRQGAAYSHWSLLGSLRARAPLE